MGSGDVWTLAGKRGEEKLLEEAAVCAQPWQAEEHSKPGGPGGTQRAGSGAGHVQGVALGHQRKQAEAGPHGWPGHGSAFQEKDTPRASSRGDMTDMMQAEGEKLALAAVYVRGWGGVSHWGPREQGRRLQQGRAELGPGGGQGQESRGET